MNGADIYGLHFQGDGAKIKYTPLLNILTVGFHLTVSVQKIVDCKGHITGSHNKDANCFEESFFDPMNDLHLWKKTVAYISSMEPVCTETQNKTFKVVYPMLSFIVGAEHTFHNVFKGWESIEEKSKLCRKDKVC